MQKNEHLSVSRDSEKFQVRMPDGMRDLLDARSKMNRRSINSEIICCLQNSLDEDRDVLRRLIASQDNLIAFLCECIEQLSQIEAAEEGDRELLERVIALYRKAVASEEAGEL